MFQGVDSHSMQLQEAGRTREQLWMRALSKEGDKQVCPGPCALRMRHQYFARKVSTDYTASCSSDHTASSGGHPIRFFSHHGEATFFVPLGMDCAALITCEGDRGADHSFDWLEHAGNLHPPVTGQVATKRFLSSSRDRSPS